MGENKSAAIKKNRTILHALTIVLTILLFTICDIIDVSIKLNKNL